MIYLIGGTPRSGKTILAKKLAKDLNISWMSVDTLEGLTQHFTSSADYKKKFPKNILRERTGGSNDKMYSQFSASKITNAYIAQAKSSQDVIAVLVEWLIGGNRDYIIEGYQVTPRLAANLLKKYGKNNIKAVFLGRKNIEKIVEDAKKGRDPDDWFLKKTRDKSTYPKIGAVISMYSNYIKQEANKYDLRYFNMDKDFRSQIIAAKNYLTR